MYQLNQCVGDDIITNASFEAARWFTPSREDSGWQAGFQDFSHLVAFSQIEYASDRQSATVTVVAQHKANATLSYSFGTAAPSDDATATFSASDTRRPVAVSVSADDEQKSTITLEPLDFRWNAAAIQARSQGNGSDPFKGGQKGAIVEMFGWPHSDVEQECAFLAEAGYMGVKVFPPQEQIMSNEPFDSIMNPWYFMYQPVSYR